jgi:hypothetical protein
MSRRSPTRRWCRRGRLRPTRCGRHSHSGATRRRTWRAHARSAGRRSTSRSGSATPAPRLSPRLARGSVAARRCVPDARGRRPPRRDRHRRPTRARRASGLPPARAPESGRAGARAAACRYDVQAARRRRLENDPAWPWSVPGETPDAASAFRAALQPHVRGTPVRVSGGPAGRYAVPYLGRNRFVVALTNDFRWVQIEWDEDKPANRPAPPADGMRVTWSRRALGGPIAWPPFRRLRAVEALTGTPLPIDTFGGGYHVDVPQFAFMALVVITRAGGPCSGSASLATAHVASRAGAEAPTPA